MPKQWDSRSLADLAEFRSGGTPSKAIPEYWGGPILWVTVKDMKAMRFSGTARTITELGAKRVTMTPKGSVLVLVRGMGLFKDLPVVLCDEAVAFNQDIKSLVPKQGVDGEFLAFALISRKDTILRHVDSAGHGTGRLDTELLRSIQLPLPPPSEQRKIADILRTSDEVIDRLAALHVVKQRQQRSVIQVLVTGKRRLPGFKSHPWKEVQLGEVLTEHKLRSTGIEEIFSVSVTKGLVNQLGHIGRSLAAKDTAHYNRVLPGDLVYTKSPTGQFPLGIVKQNRSSCAVIVSPLYGVFTPMTRSLGTLLDAWFASPVTVRNYLSPLAQKGAKNTISISNQRFLEGRLYLPLDRAEQNAIGAVVQTSQAELVGIESQIDACVRQRRALAQRLLTGERAG